MQHFTCIPFKAESRFSKVDGMAKFSPAGVIIEFESKILGFVSTGVKEVRVSIGDILDVRFRKGVFKRGAKIEIRPKSLAYITDFPNQDGKIVLKVVPEYFAQAKDAVDTLLKDMSTAKSLAGPPQTFVSTVFNESEDE